MLCLDMLGYAWICLDMLGYAWICYAMLCYAMLCYAMLCYAMLRFKSPTSCRCYRHPRIGISPGDRTRLQVECQRIEYERAPHTRTSWASQGAAIAAAWLCPAQFHVFGYHVLTPRYYIMLFYFSVLFCPRDTTDTTIRKNTQATKTLSEKEKQAGLSFVRICGFNSNTTLKNHTEIRKIERGTAVTPLGNHFMVMPLNG